MADVIERPSFYDGMILGADDLSADQDYARNQRARHNRYLHTFGVAEGLNLAQSKPSGQAYVDVTLQPGVAIDGTGREIVVAAATKLDPQEFKQSGLGSSGDSTAWFSVFLIGRDEVSTRIEVMGRCDDAQPARAKEAWHFDFGTISDADPDRLDDQDVPGVAGGPGGGAEDNAPWRVLVGFVQWSKDLKQFLAAADTAEGRRVRYAGVRADDVEARGDQLALRAGPRKTEGRPALLLAGGDKPELRYGLQDDKGQIAKPLLTVDADGNLIVTGALCAKYRAGDVYVQSGLATDGMVLPLPPGVKEEDVAAGKVALHVQVTPALVDEVVLPGPVLAPNTVLSRLATCEVDEDRRVRCRLTGLRLSTNPPGNVTADPGDMDVSGICRYVVLAGVPAAEA